MCKVLMVAGVKPKNVDNLRRFLETMGTLMSKSNPHGLGYTAMTKEGELFGQRWLDNDYAWYDTLLPDADAVKAAKKFPGMIDEGLLEETTPEMNSYGNEDWANVTAAMLHTRYATSAKGMSNTHPFVTLDNKVSLIHNGIIRNDRDFKLTLSTCDSEAILVSYLNQDVMRDGNNIQKVADELEGYYAVGVMSAVNKTIDIFKYNAQLFFTFVNELGTYVFTTDSSDITAACKALGFKHGSVFEFKTNHFMRIDAITGNMMQLLRFDKKEFYQNWNNRSYDKALPNVYDATKSGVKKVTDGILRKLGQAEVQEEIMKMVGGE
jgi:predicted glutamine amidotransferase